MKVYVDTVVDEKTGISGIAFILLDSHNHEILKDKLAIHENNKNSADLQALLFMLNKCQQRAESFTILSSSNYLSDIVKGLSFGSRCDRKKVEKINSILNCKRYSFMNINMYSNTPTFLAKLIKKTKNLAGTAKSDYEYALLLKTIEKLKLSKNK